MVYLPNRQRLRYSTNLKIKPIYWSDKTQKVKLNLETSKFKFECKITQKQKILSIE